MQLDIKQTNRILLILGIIIVVAGTIACLFLNEAQRIIIAIGVVLGIVNLLGLSYFFRQNSNRRNK